MLTQKLVVLNQVLKDLNRNWFESAKKNGLILQNSAHTEVGFNVKSGFTKILLTPKFSLILVEKNTLLSLEQGMNKSIKSHIIIADPDQSMMAFCYI